MELIRNFSEEWAIQLNARAHLPWQSRLAFQTWSIRLTQWFPDSGR